MTTTLTLAYKLSDYSVASRASSLGLVKLNSDGLSITTAPGYLSNLSDESAASREALRFIGDPEGHAATTLTVAQFKQLHLVAGQTLTLTYNYSSGEVAKPAGNDDFAFAYLSGVAINYLAYTSYVKATGGTATTGYASQFRITQTGDYDLVIGDGDVGDMATNPTLTVKSLTVSTPGTDFTFNPSGVKFNDGSQALANGGNVLPSGALNTGLFSAGTQQVLASLIGNAGGTLIGNAGGTLLSEHGAAAISDSGSGVVSNDGGSLISQDGAGLISQDGAGLANGGVLSLISQDGAGIISDHASGLISQDGAGVISDHGLGILSDNGLGLIAAGAGNVIVTNRALLSVDVPAPLSVTVPTVSLRAASRIGGDHLVGEAAPASTHQNGPQVAGLSNGKFAVVWADDLHGSFEIRTQLLNADGSAASASVVASTGTTSDQTDPSITGLSGGRYVVSWKGTSVDGAGQKSAPDIHTQLFAADGSKIGVEQRIGSASLDETNARVVSTTNGGYGLLLEGNAAGDPGNVGIGQYYDANGTLLTAFGFGSTNDGTQKLGVAGAGLGDGDLAVAYRETNPAASEKDGIYLDIVSPAGAVTHSEVQVNSTTAGTQDAPAVARLLNGNVVVAWIDEGTSKGPGLATLRAQILDPSGAKVGGEIKVADTLAGGDAPAITALSDGHFSITWDTPVVQDGTVVAINLNSQVFSADGTNAGPVFAVTTPSPTNAYRDQAPAVTQLGSGALAIVEQHTDGATSTVHAGLFNVGTAVSSGTLTPSFPNVTFNLQVSPGQNSFITHQLVTGDIDGDGKLDLVGTDIGRSSVSFLLGQGDGTFVKYPSIPVAGTPTGVRLGDFNGDGKLDIATINYDGDSITVLLNQGGHSFTSQTYSVGHNPYDLTVADVNGDGKLDLVTGDSGAYTVSILKGNGDGTFQPDVMVGRPTSPGYVLVADLNNDGRADLVTTDYNDGTATVLLGQSDGSFAAQPRLTVGATPVPAVTADVNGDGILDLIVGNARGKSVSVLLGNGDGTFGTQIVTTVGNTPLAIEARDVNNDGKIDLVVGNSDDNTVSLLIGHGDGTFDAQSVITVGPRPVGVAVADFNGDGKLDIATSNYGDGTVAVLLDSASTQAAPVITHDAVFSDGNGHAVTDTLDPGGRLLKEVVADPTSGAPLSTTTLTYNTDGTYNQHTDFKTSLGSLSVDAAYGPKGELSEITKDEAGNVTSSATVKYGDDGSITRHTTAAGHPGSDDLVYEVSGTSTFLRETRHYDDQGRLAQDQTNFRDGHEQIAVNDSGNTQSYATNNLLTDTHGNVTINQLIYDDHHQTITYNDLANIQPWLVNNLLTDTQGNLTVNQLIFDDGHQTVTYNDVANLQPWLVNNLLNDAAGRAAVNQLLFDDGHQTVTVNDLANVQPWATNNLVLDAAGKLVANQLIYDDGHQAIQINDVANVQSWATNNLVLDAAGRLVANQLIYDDGHQDITNYDVANTQPYTSNSILLDPNGAVAANSTIFDDGHVEQFHI